MGRLAEDCGRLFEAGFMLGIVRALGTLPTTPAMLAEYRRQREEYHIPSVVEEFVRGVPGEADRESARVLARYYLLKGHISGYTFLQEYLDTLTAAGSERARERERRALEVRYWQCSLQGKNRLALADRQVEAAERAMWLAQAGAAATMLRPADRARGGFLNADLLLLLRTRAGHDLLAVDVGAFSPGPQIQDPDLTIGGELLRLLANDVLYLSEKGAFARLAIETGSAAGPLFTPQLAPYFTAFSYDDKESAKLIQAASYAAGFHDFARRTGLLGADDRLSYHIIGYSGRGVNSMVLAPDQAGVLDACAQIYQRGQRYTSGGDTTALPSGEARDEARQDLYRMIARNTARLFTNGRDFMQRLEAAVQSGQPIDHEEVLTGFANTKDLREVHAQEVRKALAAGRQFVFLTGNPGIGKTTAIAEYLKERGENEGYLFFYVSPRKVVNRDIFGKFRSRDGGFYSPRFLGLTTSATLIQDAGPGMAVEYLGARSQVPTGRGVAFLDQDRVAELRQRPRTQGHSRLRSAAEDTIRDTGAQAAGVLQSICTAIGAALDTQHPNTIAATVAIQSLKRGKSGGDTLDHLRQIFSYAYNQRTGRFIAERMREIAATTRRIIFMIDEVTGDSAGYEFFRRVAEFCATYDLAQYGFEVTIVVADASITGIEVVRRHLDLDQREPDTRKIYLIMEEATAAAESAVTGIPFTFKMPDDAYWVNSNSFPATALTLRYKVRAPIRSLPDDGDSSDGRALLTPRALDDEVNGDLVRDLCVLLAADTNGQEQAIVYVQNKARLEAIITAVTQKRKEAGVAFEEGIHYMQIHADISEADRAVIEDEATREQFAMFFITSSASRGLTFTKARYIFVDIPRFQVESNLMEILQVIYRGRGGPNDDREKTITFYLADYILTRTQGQAWQLREGILRLMTMLALLKICVLTRIQGNATLHGERISLIPIGGKSVAGGGRSYHHAMDNLAHALQREMRGDQTNNPHLKRIQAAVRLLMDRAEIRLPSGTDSYLTLYEEATPTRLDEWMTGDEPVQPAYVHGSLLVVPIVGGETETVHHMGLADAVSYAVDKPTRDSIWAVMRNPQQYAPGLHDGVKELDRLVAELERVATSQRLEQRGTLQQGYYVVPLAVFVAKEAIARYCIEQTTDESGRILKQVLLDYVDQNYPVDTALPIGWGYKAFPFLVITSQDLPALRAKTFRTGHTLMSREMNLLTMLLAYGV